MECSEPSAIRTEDFMAYLAGEKVRPEVIAHLAACPLCSAQLAAYRRVELKLVNQLYRWDCPPNQILGEYQLGLVDRDLALQVQKHLSSCLLCAAEVSKLATFLADDPLLHERPPVPQEQLSVSLSSFGSRRPIQDIQQVSEQLRDSALAGTRRIIATLLPPQTHFALQRDTALQTAQWPRRYAAENVQISIQVERGPQRRGALQLLGFVTRKGIELAALQGTPVQLSSRTTAQQAIEAQYIDELGNFVFSSLSPDLYTLELLLPDGIVVIDQIGVNTQDEAELR